MASFAERLRALRIKKTVGQKEVGAIIGVSDSSIRKYEAGKRTPDPESIIKLADYFSVTTDYLLGRCDDPSGLIIDDVIIEKYIRPTLLNLAILNPAQDENDIDFISKAPKDYLLERFNSVAELKFINGQPQVKFKAVDPEITEIYQKIKSLPHEKRKALLYQLFEQGDF